MMEKSDYTNKEYKILQIMFSMFEVLLRNSYVDIIDTFTSNDLYSLAEKLNIDYWNLY